jgi:hypothetical protein
LTITVTHSLVSTKPDAGDPTIVSSNAWNDDHEIAGLGTGVEAVLAVNTGTAGSVLAKDGALGTPISATLTHATGLPISTGVSGLGANVATALSVAVGSAGAPVVQNGALGTPSSGVGTNITGVPISTGISGLGDNVATRLADDYVIRERLLETQNRYLRYNLGRCTMTIATPAVVTSAAHCPHDGVEVCTITIATPGVVTVGTEGSYTGHGFANDDPISFWTTGALPTGLTANTPTTVTTYYVRNKTDTTFEISLTAGGASIDTSGSQSGIHKFERASWLPTGVTEGQVYYITSVPDADTFQFSATEGGAAVNTSGTQAGKITLQTGNDDNDGLTLSRTGALLHVSAAIRQTQQLDMNGRFIVYNCADSTYLPNPNDSTEYNRNKKILVMIHPVPELTPVDDIGEGWPVGNGRMKFFGNEDYRHNVVWRSTEGVSVDIVGPLPWNLDLRCITVDCDWYNHFYLETLTSGFYADHLAYRGNATIEQVYNNTSGGFIYMHGTHDIFCAPSNEFALITYGSRINYGAPGAHLRGVRAYTPQSYANAMWSVWHKGSSLSIRYSIDCLGSFTGAPFYIYGDAEVRHEMWTGASPRGFQWPGSIPPIIELGGSFNTRDYSISGSESYLRSDSMSKRVAADFDKTNDTLANVTGLSFPLTFSGINYKIDATLYTTSDVAAGIKFALDGTATVDNMIVEAQVTQGTSIVVNERATALAATFGDITAVTTATVKITGSFTSTTTNGFVRLQFAQNATNASASKILEGSTMSVTAIT